MEPVSVDEAYLEFFIPTCASHRPQFLPLPSPSPLPLQLPLPATLIASKDNLMSQKVMRSSYDGNSLSLSPSDFGIMKAKELRERIFKETGCTARFLLIYIRIYSFVWLLNSFDKQIVFTILRLVASFTLSCLGFYVSFNFFFTMFRFFPAFFTVLFQHWCGAKYASC